MAFELSIHLGSRYVASCCLCRTERSACLPHGRCAVAGAKKGAWAVLACGQLPSAAAILILYLRTLTPAPLPGFLLARMPMMLPLTQAHSNSRCFHWRRGALSGADALPIRSCSFISNDFATREGRRVGARASACLSNCSLRVHLVCWSCLVPLHPPRLAAVFSLDASHWWLVQGAIS